MTDNKETKKSTSQSKKKSAAKAAKKRKKKQQQRIIIIGAVVLIVAVCAVLFNVLAGNNVYDKSNPRSADLTTTTLTEMVENTSKEAEKGPEKTSGKTVYITIDDGPSKYTDQMLKILEKYNAKGG